MGELNNFPYVQQMKCDHILQTHTRSFSNSCSISFDGTLCWPATSAEETATVPCPPTIITYLANVILLETVLAEVYTLFDYDIDNATRSCSLVEGRNEVRWGPANYTLCPKKELNAFPTFKSAFRSWWKDEYASRSTIYSRTFILCYRLGYCASLIALVIACGLFFRFKKLKNNRNRLHTHFFVSLMLRAMAMLAHNFIFQPYMRVSLVDVHVSYSDNGDVIFTEQNLWIFKLLQTMIMYFYFLTYSWLLMEGWFLHTLIYYSPCKIEISIKRYIYFGWGLPIVTTGTWLAAHILEPTNEIWLENETTKYTIIVPLLFVVSANLVFLINIVRVLRTKMKISGTMQKKTIQHKRWVRSTFLLLPMFGQYEVLSALRYFIHDKMTADMAYVISNGLASIQGIFVACVYCLMNFEVQKEVKRSWKNWKSIRDFNLELSSRKSPHHGRMTLRSTFITTPRKLVYP